MFNILSQITLKVKFLRNEEQHCLLPSLVDDFTCVHSKNALLTHILSTLFSSTSVLFSCTPFGTKSYIYIYIYIYIWACAKRCSVWTIHFLVVNASSGLSFPWTNLTLSERVCIKEIIKINLTPKVSFELVKYENLHQVRAKKSAKEGWTFRVHRFSCRFVCIFLL